MSEKLSACQTECLSQEGYLDHVELLRAKEKAEAELAKYKAIPVEKIEEESAVLREALEEIRERCIDPDELWPYRALCIWLRKRARDALDGGSDETTRKEEEWYRKSLEKDALREIYAEEDALDAGQGEQETCSPSKCRGLGYKNGEQCPNDPIYCSECAQDVGW